jgi:hypothetical protein
VPSGALVELVQAGERRSLSPDGTLTLALAPGEDALAAVGRILTMLEDRVRTSEEARASAGGIDAGVAE